MYVLHVRLRGNEIRVLYKIPTSGRLVVSQNRSSESVRLSDQGHSMITYGPISFETITPMPHTSR